VNGLHVVDCRDDFHGLDPCSKSYHVSAF
jgi:hypothetical protein